MELVNVMLNFKGSFSSTKRTIAPYFLLGVGFMNIYQGPIYVSPDSTKSVVSETSSAFAWTFGVGVEFPVGETAHVFIQGRSILGVLDLTRQYFPISGGVNFRL